MSTCSLSKQLVAHTDTTDRLVGKAHLLLDNLNGILAHVRVARTVGKEESVNFHVGIVVVPRHTDNLTTAVDKTTYDVGLNATVYENNLLASTLVVAYNLLAAHLVDKVNSSILGCRDVIGLIVEDDLAHHHTMLT